MNSIRRLGSIALVLIVGFAACNGGGPTDPKGGAQPQDSSPGLSLHAVRAQGGVRINLTGSDGFQPTGPCYVEGLRGGKIANEGLRGPEIPWVVGANAAAKIFQGEELQKVEALVFKHPTTGVKTVKAVCPAGQGQEKFCSGPWPAAAATPTPTPASSPSPTPTATPTGPNCNNAVALSVSCTRENVTLAPGELASVNCGSSGGLGQINCHFCRDGSCGPVPQNGVSSANDLQVQGSTAGTDYLWQCQDSCTLSQFRVNVNVGGAPTPTPTPGPSPTPTPAEFRFELQATPSNRTLNQGEVGSLKARHQSGPAIHSCTANGSAMGGNPPTKTVSWASGNSSVNFVVNCRSVTGQQLTRTSTWTFVQPSAPPSWDWTYSVQNQGAHRWVTFGGSPPPSSCSSGGLTINPAVTWVVNPGNYSVTCFGPNGEVVEKTVNAP